MSKKNDKNNAATANDSQADADAASRLAADRDWTDTVPAPDET